MPIMLVLPTSENYELSGFGFGSGGLGEGVSDNYKMNAMLGELATGQLTGENYALGPGLEYVQMTNVPFATTFDNPNNYYNRLRLIIDAASNPSDTLFAVAVSDDDFVTSYYVKADNRVGESLELADWRTYVDWGGASGEMILGLKANTTYKVRIKARQGKYTETGWGPEASAATVAPNLTFDIDVGESDSESSPPYLVDLGWLEAGQVVTGDEKVWVDLETNGEGGGFIYVYGTNAGLASQTTSYTIESVTGNLSVLNEGFGIRSETVSETVGGPMSVNAPYDGVNENVGVVGTQSQTIYDSSGTPVTGGRAAIVVKAKAANTTPAAGDYLEVMTIIASAGF